MNATMLPRCYNGISSSGDLNKITSSSFLSPRTTAAATILAASHPPSSSTFCPSEQERRMKLLLSAAIALTPNTDISRTCKRKRRVEFQLESNQVCHLLDANQHHSTTEDKEALWYSATSLSEFKREAKRLCQTVDIEDVIHTAYSLSNDPSADTTAIKQQMVQLPAFQEQRGLERLSSNYHQLCRNLQMVHTTTELVLAQATERIVDSMPYNVIASAAYADAGTLATRYGKASQQNVRFARLLAEVDAAVVATDVTRDD